MPRLPTVIYLSVVLAMLAGCVERTEKVTLNPDGSGKSELDIYVCQPGTYLLNTVPAPRPIPARKVAFDIIRSLSSGVDAWANVSFENAPDGRVHFKGTAYFRDIANFSVREGGLCVANFTKTPDGGMLLSIEPAKPPRKQNPIQETRPIPATPAELEAAVKEAQSRWEGGRKITAAIYNELKLNLTYALPGKFVKATILENQPGPGPVRETLVIDGKKIFAAMDKIMTDAPTLRKLILAGHQLQNGLEGDEGLMRQIIFGKADPVSAQVGGDMAPLFDYRAEADAARQAQPGMLARLRLLTDPGLSDAIETPLHPVPTP